MKNANLKIFCLHFTAWNSALELKMKVLNVFFLLVICDIELSSQDQEQELTWTNYHPFQVHQNWMQSFLVKPVLMVEYLNQLGRHDHLYQQKIQARCHFAR